MGGGGSDFSYKKGGVVQKGGFKKGGYHLFYLSV